MADFTIHEGLWLTEHNTPWDLYSHGITRVLTQQKTPYQDMSIVETGAYGKALILDGKWQSATIDEFLYHEALVQPACALHGKPKQVLVLGGGEGATIREVLRWNTVQQVTMVDIDGAVVEACRHHLPEMHQQAFDDPRVELIIGDALNFIRQTPQKWDVIISDLTDPVEGGPSFRLFTREYFRRLQQILADRGFLAVQAGSIAPIYAPIYARIVKTLQTVFVQVETCTTFPPTFAEPWSIALASPQPFEIPDDAAMIDERLAQFTTGGLRMFDGTALIGMTHVPRYLRDLVAQETQIYTLKHPPKAYSHAAWTKPQDKTA